MGRGLPLVEVVSECPCLAQLARGIEAQLCWAFFVKVHLKYKESRAMYKVVVFIPEEALDLVKNTMFTAGAGKIGDYDCCAWQVKGVGQFRPLEGSDPYLGKTNQVETVEEYRVEMVCDDQYIADVLKTMKQTHPYEEPAYDVWQLADL